MIFDKELSERVGDKAGGSMNACNSMTKIGVVTVTVILCACQASRISRPGAPLFSDPSSRVEVGPGSGGLVLADVNRDGHLDMITQHLLHEKVAVQLGDGGGRFEPADNSPLNLDYQPAAIAVADVDEDGILDLGIASRDSDKEYIHIYLGDDEVGFSEAAESPLTVCISADGYKPSVRFVDVNEDGKLDIVTGNGRRDALEIFFGDGRAGFFLGRVLSLSGRGQHSFALGDIDGAGHVDIVTASTGGQDLGLGSVVTMRGDGNGAFEEGTPTVATEGARVRTLADVNGDQRLDVVLSHDDRDRLSVGLNDGHGRFESESGPPIEVGLDAFAVVVADVDRDKRADLLVAIVDSRAAPFESGIAVLLGDGGGKFVPAPASPFRAGAGAYSLTIGDVNEDGKVDVAASSFEGEAVTLLLGR